MTAAPQAGDAFAKPGDCPDHFTAAAALVADYRRTRALPEWNALQSWAFATRMAPTLGGNHPASLRLAVEKAIVEVDAVCEADAFAGKEGKRIDKDAPKQLGKLDGDVDKLESEIAELQAAVQTKLAERAAVAEEVERLAQARELVANTTAEPAHSIRRGVFEIAKTGKHGFGAK